MRSCSPPQQCVAARRHSMLRRLDVQTNERHMLASTSSSGEASPIFHPADHGRRPLRPFTAAARALTARVRDLDGREGAGKHRQAAGGHGKCSCFQLRRPTRIASGLQMFHGPFCESARSVARAATALDAGDSGKPSRQPSPVVSINGLRPARRRKSAPCGSPPFIPPDLRRHARDARARVRCCQLSRRLAVHRPRCARLPRIALRDARIAAWK